MLTTEKGPRVQRASKQSSPWRDRTEDLGSQHWVASGKCHVYQNKFRHFQEPGWRTVDRGKPSKLGSALPCTLSCLHPETEALASLVASSPLEQNSVVPQALKMFNCFQTSWQAPFLQMFLCVPPPTYNDWPSGGGGEKGTPGAKHPAPTLECTAAPHWPLL